MQVGSPSWAQSAGLQTLRVAAQLRTEDSGCQNSGSGNYIVVPSSPTSLFSPSEPPEWVSLEDLQLQCRSSSKPWKRSRHGHNEGDVSERRMAQQSSYDEQAHANLPVPTTDQIWSRASVPNQDSGLRKSGCEGHVQKVFKCKQMSALLTQLGQHLRGGALSLSQMYDILGQPQSEETVLVDEIMAELAAAYGVCPDYHSPASLELLKVRDGATNARQRGSSSLDTSQVLTSSPPSMPQPLRQRTGSTDSAFSEVLSHQNSQESASLSNGHNARDMADKVPGGGFAHGRAQTAEHLGAGTTCVRVRSSNYHALDDDSNKRRQLAKLSHPLQQVEGWTSFVEVSNQSGQLPGHLALQAMLLNEHSVERGQLGGSPSSSGSLPDFLISPTGAIPNILEISPHQSSQGEVLQAPWTPQIPCASLGELSQRLLSQSQFKEASSVAVKTTGLFATPHPSTACHMALPASRKVATRKQATSGLQTSDEGVTQPSPAVYQVSHTCIAPARDVRNHELSPAGPGHIHRVQLPFGVSTPVPPSWRPIQSPPYNAKAQWPVHSPDTVDANSVHPALADPGPGSRASCKADDPLEFNNSSSQPASSLALPAVMQPRQCLSEAASMAFSVPELQVEKVEVKAGEALAPLPPEHQEHWLLGREEVENVGFSRLRSFDDLQGVWEGLESTAWAGSDTGPHLVSPPSQDPQRQQQDPSHISTLKNKSVPSNSWGRRMERAARAVAESSELTSAPAAEALSRQPPDEATIHKRQRLMERQERVCAGLLHSAKAAQEGESLEVQLALADDWQGAPIGRHLDLTELDWANAIGQQSPLASPNFSFIREQVF